MDTQQNLVIMPVNYSGSKKLQKRNLDIVHTAINRRLTTAPSPHFPFVNSAIGNAGTQYFDLSIPSQSYSAYLPFTNMTLNNQSGQAIYIYFGDTISQGQGIYVPSGVIKTFTANDAGGGYSGFWLQNATANSISASTIFMDVYKEGITTETALQSVITSLQRAFGSKLNINGGFAL